MIHEYFRELLEGKIGKDNPVNHERLSLISDLFGELDKLSIEQIKAFYQLLKEFDNK